ncbi:major facilitator superfamily domain-containing protein [Penicillium macrosclerotiorum]|uniref:major facilitator superfamily domain-containing protein n=1 Tax=Penicillium macrosclerotiorum TaxID=303699 RepID=UPI002548F4CF|nr:major facilitator superfamily domain-containing protein [Penicillium macrosclerotiorum]KAJ5679170.1 major facilitator superfamily domain-containing protein [Penicillium macrosclerotiorum]
MHINMPDIELESLSMTSLEMQSTRSTFGQSMHDDTATLVHNPVTDSNLVDWDGQDDVTHPRNWSKFSKLRIIAQLSLLAFYSTLILAIITPATSDLIAEFRITNKVVATMTETISSLGAAIGPLVLAPLSEITGRQRVCWGSGILYVVFTAGCSRSNGVTTYLVLRFFCGVSSGSFIACGCGSIADLLVNDERGTAVATFTLFSLLGAACGPGIGAFAVDRIGWRSTLYMGILLSGISTLFSFIFMTETNATILLARKAAHLRKETGNPALRPAGEIRVPSLRRFSSALTLPLRILFLSPIVLTLGVYNAVAFGLTHLILATFPIVYQEVYHGAASVSLLSFMVPGFGCLIGAFVFASKSDKILQRGNGPESRLLLLLPVSPTLATGFTWYGWAATFPKNVLGPAFGTALIGVGIALLTASTAIYMIDTFGPEGAASGLAAVLLILNVSETFIPLAAEPMYRKYAVGYESTIMTVVILILMPVPIFFISSVVGCEKDFL